ncbi:MAG: hypothetical protein U1A78_40460 [Polyangia bacterium]
MDRVDPAISHTFPAKVRTPTEAADAGGRMAWLRAQFGLPWRSRRNPHAAAHEQARQSEAAQLGLLSSDPADRSHKRFASFVTLDGLVYPEATLAGLEIGGTYNQWLHFLDDQYDDHAQVGQDPQAVRALMERALKILYSGALPAEPTPFDQLTLRLHQRLVSGTTGCATAEAEAWMARFLDTVRDYLLRGSLVALKRWSSAHVPTVGEYLPIRMYDSAVLTVFTLMELINDAQLPAELYDHPYLCTMRRAAAYHIIFVNDLVSYHKEVVERGSVCNMVRVLQAEEGIPLEQALRRVKQRADEALARFLASEEALAREVLLTPRLVRYIDGLKAWIGGNVDFSITSPRFRWPI